MTESRWQEAGGGNITEADAEDSQDMGALLEGEGLQYRDLRRGEVIEGLVMGADRDGILVNVGSKSEGVIPPHEMRSLGPEAAARLTVGERVLVYVLQPETPEGQILLSLDRARGEKGWRVLQQRLRRDRASRPRSAATTRGASW